MSDAFLNIHVKKCPSCGTEHWLMASSFSKPKETKTSFYPYNYDCPVTGRRIYAKILWAEAETIR